jgi:serine/threonine protein kinase/tetratricopeptide (TPR) repeat protein
MVGPGSRVFGKYEVVRRIAVGGMGEIFLARQTGVVDRLVILKSLLPQLASDSQALAQFLDEARILGSINHPNVCALFDVGEWEDLYFIAMEYINGVDISLILKFCEENKKRLPPLTSAHIVREAALGLDAAHTATDATGVPLRVVHRDISPHNIMVRQDGLTKVVDFGVAVAENRMQKTEAGLLKGKLGYMPPEQIKGAPVDPKADQFSLGVVLWEMLTQRRLFVGENAAQVFMRILKEPVPAPSSLVPDIPKELDAIVLRMTANEPVERFARLADASTAIRRLIEQYKSPDNAVQQLIRATVGPELTARLKDLASTPRVEAPSRPMPAAPGAGTPTGTPVAGGSTTAPGAFCGSCGTQAQGGDRFCRVCGATIGTGTNPKATLPAASGSATGVVPRVDVLGSRTGVVRRDDASSSPGSQPPSAAGGTPMGTRAAATEVAVVAGLVEVLEGGQVAVAPADARAAAFAVLDDTAARVGLTVTRSEDGRFSIACVGDDAIARAVTFARGNARVAARAGRNVLLRMAVAAEASATPDQLQGLRDVGAVLIDNCAPGATIIVDGARQRGGDPPTTRSATVRQRDGTSVVAHELVLPRRLVGRTEEVALLDSTLEAGARDKKAQQLMFLGDGGIGKTALLEGGQAFARDRAFLVGFARGARVSEPLALDLLRQLVRTVSLDLLANERLTGSWTRAVDVIGLAPAFAARLKGLIDDDADETLKDIPPVRRRSVIKASVLAFFEKLTDRAPVALFVDDLHKGDVQSFEFLGELGARLGDRRLVLVTAGRPVQGERVLPLAKRATLGPLKPADVVAVAGLLLSSPVVDPLAGVVVSRANGNPLLITLVLRQLTAMRQLAMSPQGIQLMADPDRLGLPPTPAGIIHANHATLPPEAQTVVLAAAHLGQVFESMQLARVVDGVKDIATALKVLADSGIIESIGTELWAFKSTVELETIPGRLDAMQGRRLQQRVADVLAKDAEGRFTIEVGERLALHLQAAEARQRAADVSLLVADRAMLLGLFELAGDHYRRALSQDWRTLSATPGAEDKAIRVLRDAALATAAMTEVDPASAVDIVAPVLKGVPPLLGTHARVEALRQRGLAYCRAKRFSEAEGCLDEGLETLQGHYDDAIAAGVLIDLAACLEQRGDADSALSQLQEALRILSRVPVDRRDRAFDGLLLLGRLGLRQRQFDPAKQALTAAIEEALRTGRVTAEADGRALMASLHQAQGNLDAAVAETDIALGLAEKVGDPVLEARLHQQRGRALVALGRRGDAAAAISRALACARAGQWDEGVSAAQQLLAVVGG